MAMPWELDKPVQQQPGAMPWEMDAPIAVAPVDTTPRTRALIDNLGGPSSLPNSVAEANKNAVLSDNQIGADFSQYFANNPINMPATPVQTPEQAAADEAALLRDIKLNRNPDDRSALYKMQQVAKAPTDIIGAPVDIGTMITNALLYSADKAAKGLGYATGADLGVDARIPYDLPGSSDWLNAQKEGGIDNIAAMLANAFGQQPMGADETTVIPPEDVSAQDRILGSGLRFGGGALLTGGMLAAKNAVNPAKSGLMATMEAPYAGNTSKALMGDTLAGLGSGVTSEAYNEYVPDAVKEQLGPIGNVLAAMFGGIGGSTLNSAGHATVDAARNAVKDSKTFSPLFTDPSVPINPDTGQLFKPSEIDMSARIAQNMPSDIDKTVANLRRAKDDFAFAAPDQMPTTGMMADDIGMAINENVARTRNPQRFLERDAERNALATSKIDQSAPALAEGRKMTERATDLYDTELNAARQKLDDAARQQELGGADIVKQNLELDEARNRQNQSSAALDAEFRRQNEVAMAKKNALYDAKPDDTPIAAKPLYEELMAIEESVPRAARANTDYASTAKRIRDLIHDPETGGFKDLTYGDVKVLKTEVSAARKEAVAAGRDVTQLDKLNGLLGQKINEINPEAAKYFADEFSPRFRTGKSGEYSKQLKAANRTNEESSATRPSEFAGKFLGKPEDAKALQRAIDVNGNPVTAENATQWMVGDLAKSGVTNAKGELRYDNVRQWANKNKDVIDQFPEMRKRIDTELKRAEQGGRLSKTLADEVKTAAANLDTTQESLRRSALQHAIGKDPERTIASIMGSGDPEKQMADLVGRLKPDKDATEGLKVAVRDWIKDKSGTTAQIVGKGDVPKMSAAKLDRLFNKHEKTLAKVYTPVEMNNLRQAHKLLDVAANLDVKATAGSNSLDKFFAVDKNTVEGRYRMLEVALKAKYGVLAGGGKFRTLRLFFDAVGSLSSKPKAVENALYEAYFNPDFANHLLTRNVKEIGTPAWNAKLNRYLSIASGNRDDEIEEAPE